MENLLFLIYLRWIRFLVRLSWKGPKEELDKAGEEIWSVPLVKTYFKMDGLSLLSRGVSGNQRLVI